ncbi:hypothetical protein DRO91_01340 [Candidatus Heimdallarchaeota archaeon]|nr:MAG: hypothetical protein DRO91_01340 [Candidatus Heimdallarchaeota archaeon]
MTYVPPEKKQKGGTSSFGDIVYIFLFYLIEGLFIIIGVPALVVAIGLIPIAMYVIIRGETNIVWPLYVLAVAIIFFQILALQYFVKKYVLEPHKMRLGQWLRWKFSPKEIKKRRLERQERTRKMEAWYGGMDKVKEEKEQIKKEQSYDLRSEWYYKETDDEIMSEAAPKFEGDNDEGIIIIDDSES